MRGKCSAPAKTEVEGDLCWVWVIHVIALGDDVIERPRIARPKPEINIKCPVVNRRIRGSEIQRKFIQALSERETVPVIQNPGDI